jgi:hypothetical protein
MGFKPHMSTGDSTSQKLASSQFMSHNFETIRGNKKQHAIEEKPFQPPKIDAKLSSPLPSSSGFSEKKSPNPWTLGQQHGEVFFECGKHKKIHPN